MKNKTYIIAEIAQGFEGNPWICKKFIDVAKNSGADAVKFQIFKADELATCDYQHFDLFRSLEISSDTWIDLIKYANSIQIDFLSDIYGMETLTWISTAGIKGIKVHSTDIMNYPLLKSIRDTGLITYLAVGGSSEKEIEEALKITGKSNVILISGFQAEPNVITDIELDKINQLKTLFEIPVGYADHIDANSNLATVIPVMAIEKGATVIEKHLTIDRANLQLEDYISALNPDEFKNMVSLIREVEGFPTTERYQLSDRELLYRNKTKRSIILNLPISQGEKLTDEHLKLRRTGNHGDFYDMNEVIGKKVKKALPAGTLLTKEDIDE